MIYASDRMEIESFLDPLRNAVRKQENDYKTQYILGLALVYLEQVTLSEELKEEAIEPLRRATILKPNFAEAYKLLGKVMSDLEMYHEATPVLRKAIQLNPEDPVAYTYLLMAIEDLAEFDQEFRREYIRAMNKIHELTQKNLKQNEPPEDWDDYKIMVDLWDKYALEINETGEQLLTELYPDFKLLVEQYKKLKSTTKKNQHDSQNNESQNEQPEIVRIVKKSEKSRRNSEKNSSFQEKNLPKKLKPLANLAETWGVVDDETRTRMIQTISKSDMKELETKVSGKMSEISKWLKTFKNGNTPTEVKAFRNLVEVYETLKTR